MKETQKLNWRFFKETKLILKKKIKNNLQEKAAKLYMNYMIYLVWSLVALMI